MAESATAPISNVEDKENFKAFLLSLLKDDDSFAQNVKESLNRKKSKIAKNIEPEYPALSKEDIPLSEMPFWKLYPDFMSLDPTPYRISKEAIEELQELWKDMPPAEELIAQLTC